MNILRPYKFLVIPVLQTVDEEGIVVNEVQPQQPDTVFGVEALMRYADGFEAAVAAQNAASQNGAVDVPQAQT